MPNKTQKTVAAKEPKFTGINKIKKPVLLIVDRPNGSDKFYNKFNRIRILYPNGKCEWNFKSKYNPTNGKFELSCFIPDRRTLDKTVAAMQNYDRDNGLKIVEVIEL